MRLWISGFNSKKKPRSGRGKFVWRLVEELKSYNVKTVETVDIEHDISLHLSGPGPASYQQFLQS